MRLVISYNV